MTKELKEALDAEMEAALDMINMTVAKHTVSLNGHDREIKELKDEDKPPIVVTSSDINIETIVTSANFVYLKWNCTDANCTSFSVMTSEDGSSWSLAGTTSNKEFTVSGFLVGRTRWWKITSSYFREEEE